MTNQLRRVRVIHSILVGCHESGVKMRLKRSRWARARTKYACARLRVTRAREQKHSASTPTKTLHATFRVALSHQVQPSPQLGSKRMLSIPSRASQRSGINKKQERERASIQCTTTRRQSRFTEYLFRHSKHRADWKRSKAQTEPHSSTDREELEELSYFTAPGALLFERRDNFSLR